LRSIGVGEGNLRIEFGFDFYVLPQRSLQQLTSGSSSTTRMRFMMITPGSGICDRPRRFVDVIRSKSPLFPQPTSWNAIVVSPLKGIASQKMRALVAMGRFSSRGALWQRAS